MPGFRIRMLFLMHYTSTNRLALTQGQTALDGGFCYDKFGNMVTDNGTCPSDVVNIPALYSYDVANRLTGSGPAHGNFVFMYNAQNQRVAIIGTGHALSEQLFFYGFQGEKLATTDPSTASASTVVENVYLAGQLWMQGLDPRVGTNVLNTDQLGSVRGTLFTFPGGGGTPGTTYLPFGEELNATSSDREKFGTYTRDSATVFDYANQRYYASQYGRFLTADPYKASGGAADPGSWNRYSYVQSDPINLIDPQGEFTTIPAGGPQYGQNPTPAPLLTSFSSFGNSASITSGPIHYRAAKDVENDGGGGGWALSDVVRKSLSDLAKVPWSASWSGGLPATFGILGAGVTGSYIPESNTLCVGLQLVASPIPGGASGFSLGPSAFGSLEDATKILGGWGWSINLQDGPFLGIQFSGSASGSLSGPTVGSKGMSASAGYSVCKQL